VEGQLNANFTTNPIYNSSNQLTVCSGSTVLLTFISTGSNIISTTTVNWTFTTISGTPLTTSSSNLRTPFPITFTNGNYTVTLTLTNPGGATNSKTITIIATSPPPISPSLSLSATSLTNNWSVTTINSITTFKICPPDLTQPVDVLFNIPSITSCTNISSMNITDLDPNGQILCSPGSIYNIYYPQSQRFYYSVFTVQFNNGCTFSQVYYIQIGTPSISITSASSTACDPGLYTLAFTDQTPGVTYQIDWDYNAPTFSPSLPNYVYPNLPLNPQKVSHSYPYTPCVNGQAPSNIIRIQASNSCPGESYTNPSIVFVSKAPDAGFTRNPNLDVICQGTQVSYSDTSYSGVYVNTSGLCSNTYNKWWVHDPQIGLGNSNTSNVTNLGTPLTNGPSSFNVVYNTPGTYTIKLIVKNTSCGNDTMVKTVCVVPAVQANFNPNLTTGCVPLTVLTTNNSSLPGCPGTNMLYNWSVTNAPPTCGTPAWSFSPGFNSNSSAPSINFTGPGQYTIKLVTSLNPSVAGAQCQNDTLTQTITVKDKPIVNIPSPSPICQGQSFTPTATVNDCYNPSSTYAWSFINGSPLSSTVLNPGSVSYTNSGNFTYTLIATNSCGSTTSNNTITVNPIAIVNAGVNDTVCQGTSVTLNGLVSGGATGGTWQSTPTGGSFLPNANTLNASYIPSLGTTGNVVLTLTATGTTSPCPSVSDDKIIVFNPKPTVSAGNDTTICAGSNVNLHGTIGGAATNATWTTATPGSGSFSNANALNNRWVKPCGE
jgi:PKD repeat protein